MLAKLTTALGKSSVLIIALALLAAAGVLGARHTITGAESYGVVLVILGGGSVSAGIALGSPLVPNSAVLPHLLVLLGALAVISVLATLAVLSDTQVFGVLELVLGGSTAGAMSAISSAPPPTPALTPQQALQAAQTALDAAMAAVDAAPKA